VTLKARIGVVLLLCLVGIGLVAAAVPASANPPARVGTEELLRCCVAQPESLAEGRPFGAGWLLQLTIAVVVALGGLGLGVVLWHIGPWGRESRESRADRADRDDE
jgi:hypothetical protein